ncbi:hypothetical protein H6F67_00940 [Microcoleus sp. FACHB-1515]|uniref:MHYT domain-containing protein n=1 Tax=Cyanophyceae TaxID=3028117 RepID=UPI001688CCF2|nr:MHYT domain-containing protein [Microcoleus sp. FACHB-1515]MBD2088438.1 hypothetical protein [Microcoleus sp. FACHB-1515]
MQNKCKLGGALCLGLAVCGMHCLAMNATVFHAATIRLSRFSEIDNAFLAIVIAVAALLIIVLALLASFFSRRSSAEIA